MKLHQGYATLDEDMVTQELIQYIKTQIQAGQTKETVMSNLIANKWSESDIESAFQTIRPNLNSAASSNSTPSSNSSNKSFPLILVLVLIVCLVLVAGEVFVLNSFIKNKPSSDRNALTNLAQASPSPLIITPTIAQNNPDENVLYSSSQQGYGFRYIKSWKIDKQGALTVLVNLDNAKFQECAATLEKILACDIAVSTIPYAGEVTTAPGVSVSGFPTEKTHDEQVKDLATQLAAGNTIASTSFNNLRGYEAPTTNPDGSTFNVLLQGSKNMILVQFPYKKMKSDLTFGQLIVLNSIIEQ